MYEIWHLLQCKIFATNTSELHNQRNRPETNDPSPVESLFNLEEYFLHDLDNEEENEFLAAVDLENVNVTDKVDTVIVDNADRSTEVNKRILRTRFNVHPSSHQLKACSDIVSSAWNELPQPSPGAAVITSSESPHAGVLHS